MNIKYSETYIHIFTWIVSQRKHGKSYTNMFISKTFKTHNELKLFASSSDAIVEFRGTNAAENNFKTKIKSKLKPGSMRKRDILIRDSVLP